MDWTTSSFRKTALELASVSICFFLAYYLTAKQPAFLRMGGAISETAFVSLVFLPHGVRIIAAWLFGFRAIFLLAPVSYAIHFTRVSPDDHTGAVLFAPIFGVVCASLVFEILAKLGVDLRLKSGFMTNWKNVALVGVAASVINSLGTNYFYGNGLRTTLAFWVGDVIGMLTLMLILMLAFRALRIFNSRKAT